MAAAIETDVPTILTVTSGGVDFFQDLRRSGVFRTHEVYFRLRGQC